MFYYISGKLAKLDGSFAVIDAGGVGFKMTISKSTFFRLSGKENTGDVKLYTYMAVREDGTELFGFSSEEELSAFKLLITVSGVGPKAAISILSTLTPEKLALAICTEDKKAISQASGIGPKSAARIILELKDKLKADGITASDDASVAIGADLSGVPDKSGKLSDAQDALTVLGYSRSEAAKVLATIDTASLELDDIIRLALKKLMK
ncbi:MAG: Holliday junction branch migration protein RuvA [Clostridia bacterium]|nr:Holliday junction branch migration protein RuvA [Clostridia bacterium]